jgi:hypothetical protein
MESLIYFLLIGIAAGWLAGRITKGLASAGSATSSSAFWAPSWADLCFALRGSRPTTFSAS